MLQFHICSSFTRYLVSVLYQQQGPDRLELGPGLGEYVAASSWNSARVWASMWLLAASSWNSAQSQSVFFST